MRSYVRVDNIPLIRRLFLYPWLAWILLLVVALLCVPGARCRHTTAAKGTGAPALLSTPRPPGQAPTNETCADTNSPADLDVSDPRASCLRGASTGQNKARRLEAFKKDMLAKLGLEALPPRLTPAQRRNATHITSVRTYIAEHSQRQQEAPAEEEREQLRVSRVVTFGIAGNGYNVSFNLTDRIRLDTLDKAYVNVYIRGTGKEEGAGAGAGAHIVSLTIRVPGWRSGEKQLSSPKTTTTQEGKAAAGWTPMAEGLVELAKKVPMGKEGQWVSVTIAKPLRYWLEDINRERVLTVDATDEQGRHWAIVQPAPHEKDFGVYLDVQLRDKQTRGKRSLPRDCREEGPASYCCRYPLTVNFSQLGWDFVLHPPAYEAYYCSGDCQQHTVLSPDHTYAIMATNTLDARRRATPNALGPTPSPTSNVGPCCAAHKAQDMELMYLTPSGDIVIGTLPGMSVLRCACT